MTRTRWKEGAAAGTIAGAVMVAAMYLGSSVLGTRPLPELLQEPILAALPGPVFGFLIDNLQHLGKVVEEAGLIGTLIALLGAVGVLYAFLDRRQLPQAALLLTAAAWLVTVGLVLPLLGDGPFGLAEGFLAPAAWGVLYVLYAIVLQFAYRSLLGLDGETDPGRRRTLVLLPAGLGAAGLGLLGWRLLPGWFESVVHPPEAGITGPVSEITPAGDFYVVSKNFADPIVAAATWRLRVHGLVARELSFDYDALRRLPSATEYSTFECISNNVGGPLESTGSFTGVRLQDLVTMAEPVGNARTIEFRSHDGYSESIPLSVVMAAPEILVAHQLNGSPLPHKHGFPARVVLPGRYGMKQPKWLEDIELRTDDPGGFWEAQGWDKQAFVRTMSRIDYPRDGFILKHTAVMIAGIAFAGTRGVKTVEVSTDGGGTWSPATFKAPLSNFTWTLWSTTWMPAREGIYTLVVRARDGVGQLQDSAVAPSFPSGATGYHTIKVTVSR